MKLSENFSEIVVAEKQICSVLQVLLECLLVAAIVFMLGFKGLFICGNFIRR